VWSKEHRETGRGWLLSASSTLLRHLRDCEHQASDIQEKARQSHGNRRAGTDRPTHQRVHSHPPRLDSGVEAPLDYLRDFTETFGGAGPSRRSHPNPSPLDSPWPAESPAIASGSLPPSFVAPPSQGPGTPLSETSSFSLPTPSDVLPLSRSLSRTRSRGPSVPHASWVASIPWTQARQKLFEERVALLTVSAGLPLAWVDNNNWRILVQDFIPGANSFSRKVLTTRLIPSVAKKFRAQAQTAVKGLEATLQADGWTGLNNHHLIAFMITVEGKVRGKPDS
jgi:hypothetical protein